MLAGLARKSRKSLVYAIGDIHGMYDLMTAMLAKIENDARSLGLPATIVFLGDLVNRGPKTRQVIDHVLAGPRENDFNWIALRGNHEQIMLDALQSGRPAAFQNWLGKGGIQTLSSYGASNHDLNLDEARRLIGPAHKAFLSSLPLTLVIGKRLFVHAGVEPGVPLDQQSAKNLMSIRGPFFERPHGLPYTVVHGHTPVGPYPLLGPGRIGLDTGAVTTGILTAAAFGPGKRDLRFLRVLERPVRLIKSTLVES